jgi:hypothetical protein
MKLPPSIRQTNGGSAIVQMNHAYDLAGNRTNRMESFTGYSINGS